MLAKEAIEKYFLAEKAKSRVFMTIGIKGMLPVLLPFFLKLPFIKAQPYYYYL